MSRQLWKVCVVGGFVILVAGVSSDAQAGGRHRACHCQQYGAPAVTYAAPANNGGTVQYQSAYQAPAAAGPTYFAPGPAVRSHGWDEKAFARHIKGLD